MILDLLWRKLNDISFLKCIVSDSNLIFIIVLCIKRSVDTHYLCSITPPDVLEMQFKKNPHARVSDSFAWIWYLEIHID